MTSGANYLRKFYCSNDKLNPSDIPQGSTKLFTCPPGDAHSFVDDLRNDEVDGVTTGRVLLRFRRRVSRNRLPPPLAPRRPTLRLLGFLYGSIVVGALFAAPMIWLGFIFPDTSPKPTTRPAKKLAPSAVNLTLYEVHEIYDNESDAKSGSGKPLKRWVYEVDVVRKRSLLSES